MSRPLRLGCFTATEDRVIAVDDRAPIVAEVAINSGEVLRVRTWSVPPFTGKPVASEVAVVGGSVVIASPAAGGIVVFRGDDDEATVIAFDVPIGDLVVHGDAVWAIADAEWYGDSDDEPFGRRPVIWEDPTAEEVAAARAEVSGWSALIEQPDGVEVWVLAGDLAETDDGRADPYDDRASVIGPPTPLWRIAGIETPSPEALSFDIGGQLRQLLPIGDQLLAFCELPTDPLVKRRSPYGGHGHEQHSTLLVGDHVSGFRSVRSGAETAFVLGADDARAWTCEQDGYGGPATLQSIDLTTGEIAAHPVHVEDPIAVVGDVVVDCRYTRGEELWLVPIDGRAPTPLGLTGIARWTQRTVGRSIWFIVDDRSVVGTDTGSGVVREVRIDVDCAPFLPAYLTATADEPITLPVMLDSWELECCQPHATVGEEWTALMVLDLGGPWWLRYATGPVPDDVRSFGVVELEGVVLRPAPRPHDLGLVATGPVRFAASVMAADQHLFRGVIRHEAHGGGPEGVLGTEIECTGTVRRIQGVAYRHESQLLDGEEGMVPVAQEPPVDLRSTADGQFDTYVLTIEFLPGAAG